MKPLARRLARLLREPVSVRAAAAMIVAATALVVVIAGALMTVVDNGEYPNVWIGMWWALQTVTTVGYGDVTPENVAGRAVGALIMLEGVAFIAIVTAAITSSFVTRARNQYEASQSKDELSDRELMEKRFDELEQKLDSLITTKNITSIG
jgi:voltage-gated potassium channel Kch